MPDSPDFLLESPLHILIVIPGILPSLGSKRQAASTPQPYFGFRSASPQPLPPLQAPQSCGRLLTFITSSAARRLSCTGSPNHPPQAAVAAAALGHASAGRR